MTEHGTGRVLRLVRLADRLTMPWKNGGGITHELLREDREGTLVVRLSVADVATQGPFSLFPGVDRVILLLAGSSCVLTRSDGHVVRLRPREPYCFAGEDAWSCTLPDGPVSDFNVMTARGHARAAVSVQPPGPLNVRYALALEHGNIGGALVEAGELVVMSGVVSSAVAVVAVDITNG